MNKIENTITFEIKKGYYLQLLAPQKMKLLGSTKSKDVTMKMGMKLLK